MSNFGARLKVAFDCITALLLLVLLSPIMLLISLLILFTMGRPVLFSQARAGKNGVVFQFYKFRTMSPQLDTLKELDVSLDRVTALGSFLRSTSLDELPQLINILKGDMSLVGPRPLLAQYLELYTEYQAKRHDVLPGITGWCQINGRNALSWEEKFDLDIWYVNNQSLWLDLKILFLTLLKVIKKENVDADSSNTMELFKGSK